MKKSLFSRLNQKRKNAFKYLEYALLKFARLFVSHKKGIILFDNLFGDSEEIDAKQLYHYLKQQHYEVFYIAKADIGRKKSRKFLFNYFKPLMTCQTVMTSFTLYADYEPFLPRLGINYVFLQHGVSLFKASAVDFYREKDFDYTVVSCEPEYQFMVNRGWHPAKLIQAGLPRWDKLPSETRRATEAVLVMFTWRHSLNQPDVPLQQTKYYQNLSSLLNALANVGKPIYLALHHAFSAQIRDELQHINQNIHIISNHEISTYVRRCDRLITDYSSIAFDFFYQDKPVIFYTLDEDDALLVAQERHNLAHFNLVASSLLPLCVTANESEVLNLLDKPLPSLDSTALFYCKKDVCQQLERQFKQRNLIAK